MEGDSFPNKWKLDPLWMKMDLFGRWRIDHALVNNSGCHLKSTFLNIEFGYSFKYLILYFM